MPRVIIRRDPPPTYWWMAFEWSCGNCKSVVQFYVEDAPAIAAHQADGYNDSDYLTTVCTVCAKECNFHKSGKAGARKITGATQWNR